MIASILRKICYFLRVLLLVVQHVGDCKLLLFEAVHCVLLLVKLNCLVP